MRELPKRKRTPERQEFYDFMLNYKDKGQDLDEDDAFGVAIFVREQDIAALKKYISENNGLSLNEILCYMDKLEGKNRYGG